MEGNMLPPFSSIEMDTASQMAETLDPGASRVIAQFDDHVEHQVIDEKNFPLFEEVRQFYGCTFSQVHFLGYQANNIAFRDCELRNCRIEDANFKFSDFSGSNMSLSGSANSFDSSDFSNTTLHDADLSGCSFSDSFFYGAHLMDCRFVHSEFISSIFSNVDIDRVNFTLSNLDYAEFEQADCARTMFPYWGALHVAKGFRELLNGEDVWFVTRDASHRAAKAQYLEELHLMQAFLYKKKDYFALANLYIVEGETNRAYAAVMDGIAYYCGQGLLKPLRHLCRLASVNSFFTSQQLRGFYGAIEKSLSNRNLTLIQYKNYTQELDIARRLLIDHPFDQDTIDITIQTSIPHTDYQSLSASLRLLDTLIEETAPLTINHIEIRHNSPVELLVQAAGEWQNLLLIFIAIGLALDKGTTLIERVQNIISNHKKNAESESLSAEIAQLNQKIDALNTAYQRLETASSARSSALVLRSGAENFESVSYLLQSKHKLPEDLRTYHISK